MLAVKPVFQVLVFFAVTAHVSIWCTGVGVAAGVGTFVACAGGGLVGAGTTGIAVPTGVGNLGGDVNGCDCGVAVDAGAVACGAPPGPTCVVIPCGICWATCARAKNTVPATPRTTSKLSTSRGRRSLLFAALTRSGVCFPVS